MTQASTGQITVFKGIAGRTSRKSLEPPGTARMKDRYIGYTFLPGPRPTPPDHEIRRVSTFAKFSPKAAKGQVFAGSLNHFLMQPTYGFAMIDRIVEAAYE